MRFISDKNRVALHAGVSIVSLCASLSFVQPGFAQDTTSSTTATAKDDTVVVVSARRRALQSATELKKKSDTIIDSVVADEAGKLPDNSITEVLARIPGVTMSRFNNYGDSFAVEGTGIQVRGLSSPSSLLNGREIFGANGGSGLSWGEVTPELMAAVDVYKATRADMIEGGTGGAIDLRTKMPFDYKKPTIEGAVSLSKGDLVGRTSPSGSVLWTRRFDTPLGEMGLLVDVAYSKLLSQDGHLSVEPYFKRQYKGQTIHVPGGFGWGDDHFERERTGLYEAFQWKPNNSLTIWQTMFSSHYTSNNNGASAWVADSRIFPTGSNVTIDGNGFLLAADKMQIADLNDGSLGSTVGQGWIPSNQQVNCNGSSPYGTQAHDLNWGASPPDCTSAVNMGVGSARGFSTSDNRTSDYSQGFTWNVSEATRVRGALQFVDSNAHSTGMSTGLNSGPLTSYSMDISGNTPVFNMAGSDIPDNPADPLNKRASYGWGFLAWRPSNNHGTMVAANLDVDHELGDGFFKTLSAGVRYASRVEHDHYDGTYWTPLGNGWDGSPQKYLSDGPASDAEFYPFENFFHNSVRVPHTLFVPSESRIRTEDYNYMMSTYGFLQGTKAGPDGILGTSDDVAKTPYDVIHQDYGTSRTTVETQSFYIQAKFGSDTGLFGVPYTGNIGLRYVKTHTEASGNFVFNADTFYMTQADADADFLADMTGVSHPRAVTLTESAQHRSDQSDDTRVLPAFNINFKPTDKFFIRVAANQTISRPSFNDVTVAGNGSVSTLPNPHDYTDANNQTHSYPHLFNGLTANFGNTTLKPTLATNFDLSFEWYKSYSTTAHLSLFHKDLKNLIILGNTFVPFPYSFTKGDGTVVTGTTSQSTTQATNAKEKAEIQGFEFGGRTFFDSLPGFWSGFGVEANFTYIDSHNPAPLSYDMDGNKYNELPVTGLSKYSANINLMYSKDNLYVGLAYNWRSRWLLSTNVNGTGTLGPNGTPGSTYTYCADTSGTQCSRLGYALPLYGHEYGQLDFGANYKFSDRIKVYLQANNLTNVRGDSEVEVLPGKFYPRNYYESDRRIDIGVNFSF